MSARPSKIGRQPVSYMLAPSTIARLTMLSGASGLSRGRILDRAVESLVPCKRCDGSGTEASPLKGSTLRFRCERCKGTCFEE